MTSVFNEHLTLDVVVAYADGEMSLTAFQRAAAHVMRCASCAADVAEQTAASQYLRQATLPRMPGSLFDTLKSIPVASPRPGPVPGVLVDSASGRTMRAADSALPGRGRRFRLGAGALVAGLAVGALVVAASGDAPVAPPTPSRSDPTVVSRSSGPGHPSAASVVVQPAVARTAATR
ncbi:hypothetical protein SAMN04515671_4176 [Nakamurella panacisegetis]|uniref:Zinc-finger n=1 Tax=Nakamurella panacisegetis TaxID=1090615 RepID=A0A1H0SN69_9ACTN|nr:hypothetical protein [Nakamurella panacisegetis]SDP42616.1 hypothetical protein SAMN04515671_4176 [Nakamurella panacisegetis]